MKTPAKKVKKPQPALAVHATVHAGGEDVHHIVGLGNIRVIIVPDGAAFFAQGLEIDYAAQGSTVDETKRNFEIGLEDTIQHHLTIYGSIKALLQPAPASVWQELLPDKTAVHDRYWHISEHAIEHSALPYEGIKYLIASQTVQKTCE